MVPLSGALAPSPGEKARQKMPRHPQHHGFLPVSPTVTVHVWGGTWPQYQGSPAAQLLERLAQRVGRLTALHAAAVSCFLKFASPAVLPGLRSSPFWEPCRVADNEGSWSFFNKNSLLQVDGDQMRDSLKKGISRSPTDLSGGQKQLWAPNYSAVLTQLMILTAARRPEHPACIRTAAGRGQSPRPTLPSSSAPSSNPPITGGRVPAAARPLRREVAPAPPDGLAASQLPLSWLVLTRLAPSSPPGCSRDDIRQEV